MKFFYYRVYPNETVFSISKKFNVSIFDIIFENSLENDVQPGDLLIIPKNSFDLYAVQPQDTLQSIALKLNVSLSELKEKNNNLPYIFYGLFLKY